MQDISVYQDYAKTLRSAFLLRSYPIAVKFYENIEDVPKNAIFPKRDLGKHMAMCQAFSYSRMRGATVAMTKTDHWCWNPLIGFGAVECLPGQPQFDEVVKFLGIRDKAKAETFFAHFPRLPMNRYAAVVTAPLETAEFYPDVVLIYAEAAKINHMLRGIKAVTGDYVRSIFDGIDSCVYCTVPSMQTNEYRITFPDPGDRERAHARDDEVILTIPGGRLDEFMGSQDMESTYGRFGDHLLGLELDFARPPFYTKLFELWGLDPDGTEEN